MIVSLHHVQITVPRGAEHQARQFYCVELGLPEIPKPASLAARGGFWIQLGAVQLHIGVEDGVDRSKTRVHLAFEVDDLSHIRALMTRLGREIKEGEAVPGLMRFEVRDPFGNRIEFVQELRLERRRGRW